MIRNSIQNIDGFGVTTAADVVQCSIHMAVVLALTSTGASVAALTVGLTAVTIAITTESLTAESLISKRILLFILDLLVRLLDFLELLFRLGIALIYVRVILSAHGAILFFQLFVGDTSLDT